MARVIKTLEYSIADVVPYINGIYFFHAWGLSGKPQQEKQMFEIFFRSRILLNKKREADASLFLLS